MKRIGLGLALFLCFQGLYLLTASGRVNRVADEFEVYLQVESLWDRGSLAIPQVPEQVFFGKRGRDGQPYAPYGPGVAFLALPHHALGRGLVTVLRVPREAEPAAWTELVAAVTSLASATWAALAVLGLFRAALALGAGPPRAALSASLLGGATLIWPYGTFFFSEAASAAALIWAVVFWLEERPHLAELAVVVLLVIKVTNVVWLPGLVLLAAGTTRPDSLREALIRVRPFLLAAVWAGVVHVGWNLLRFGEALEFGYAWTEFIPRGEAPRAFTLGGLPTGLVGLLLTPGKSVLLFAPPLLLACARLRVARAEQPALFRAWIATAAAGLLFFGAYFYWEGGYCFGPRFLVPALPLLLLPLALGPTPRRAALLPVVVFGVAIQLLGVTVSFMEDQAAGMRERPPRSRYYAVVEPSQRPVGRPLNVYRMGYSPLFSYPPLLIRHLRATPGTGATGLELWPLHLLRVRARAPVPLAAVWLVPVLGLLLLVGGAWTARKELRSGDRDAE